MTRVGRTITAMTVMLMMAAPTSAFWAWMRGAAAREFTDADWELFQAQARRALEEDSDGVRTDWSNPETGNGGSIRPLKTLSLNDQRCRQIAFRNVTATGITGQAAYHLCKQEDGTWQFVAESEIDAANASSRANTPSQ